MLIGRGAKRQNAHHVQTSERKGCLGLHPHLSVSIGSHRNLVGNFDPIAPLKYLHPRIPPEVRNELIHFQEVGVFQVHVELQRGVSSCL